MPEAFHIRMKPNLTIGEKYGPAMKIADQGEADRYFEQCVAHTMSLGKTRAEAEIIERQNLGYYAGYYDNATRERVERLFRCAHPVLGSIAKKGAPTPRQAFAAGVAAAAVNRPSGGTAGPWCDHATDNSENPQQAGC